MAAVLSFFPVGDSTTPGSKADDFPELEGEMGELRPSKIEFPIAWEMQNWLLSPSDVRTVLGCQEDELLSGERL